MPWEPPAEGCWEWTSGGNGKGYGQMEFGGKGLPAHAVVRSSVRRRLADDDSIRHTCDNPPCVNPAHLLPGTPPDNRQDWVLSVAGRPAVRASTCQTDRGPGDRTAGEVCCGRRRWRWPTSSDMSERRQFRRARRDVEALSVGPVTRRLPGYDPRSDRPC